MKAVPRPRWPLAVGAASALLLAAGPSAASTPAPATPHGSRGVTVVVCGRDGRIGVLVRVSGAVLLPIGQVAVRVGGTCGPRPGTPSPGTPPPVTPPPTTPPTPPPGPPPVTPPPPTPPPATSPPAPPPATSPPATTPASALPVPTGTTPRAAGYASGPDRESPRVRPAPGSASHVYPTPSGTDDFALPQPGGEPHPHGAGGGAARWWLLTMAVVLLPAVLAAVPYRYRTSRRRS
ncbi:hypothetical protein [Streptomyces sp. NRRL F-5123]|uniref:hypothetical protein n=1 Tax=Streptomyces sp. NRRL F-5123 TaxID=1463856 RepID=UPI0004E251BF|nr:hypothetical protein [Streptomyces sp. NRRL F-5123]